MTSTSGNTSGIWPYLAAAFAITIALGSVMQWVNVRQIGSGAAALRVGEDSETRAIIEQALGEIPLTEGIGHDGQYYFISALDPLLLNEERTAIYSTYRQRRVGLPLLASLAGSLPPAASLLGLLVMPVVGLALAAAGAIGTGCDGSPPDRRRCGILALAGVLANPGLWLSLALVTADTLALGFALLGLWAARRNRPWVTAALFLAAALTKETHLVFALATTVWLWRHGDRRSSLAVGLVPVFGLGTWLLWVGARSGVGGVGGWNFGLPFQGIIEAAPAWTGGEGVLAALTLLSVGFGLVVLARSRATLVRLSLAPWLAMAVLTSEVVWRDGNNAIRVFAPILTLGVLGALPNPEVQPDRTSRKNLPV